MPMDLSALHCNYHAMLAQSPDPCVLVDLHTSLLVDVNLPAETMLGRTRAQLLSMRIDQLCPDQQPDGGSSRLLLKAQMSSAGENRSHQFPLVVASADGRQLPCEALLIRLPVAGHALAHGRLVDISERLRAEKLRDGQSEILEMITGGAALKPVLDRLVGLVESLSPGVLCSVLLLDDDGFSLRPMSGPSLPAAYMKALDGMHIGPHTGSCGVAMYAKKMVISPDIQVDPNWAPYLPLATPFGLRACWSTPIIPDGEDVLGSFAMYYHEVRSPHESDIRLIGIASHLAGIALQRHRRQRELKLHREHLEELVTARTTALTAAVARADQINRELSSALATLSKAQDELVRRDKLAALGVLVAGVAHELNTPIGNSVVAATSLAERTHALRLQMAQGLRRSELERFLAEAGEAGDLLVRNLKRAATLVAGFKQIAVDQASADRRHFSLSQLLSDLAAPLRVAAKPARITLELDLAHDLTMDSYPGPLSQVVTELFENCLEHAFAGISGGVVRISAIETGSQVSICVADNGVGIAAAIQARVYDPFFTSGAAGARSGLGLHVVHNIVTNILGGSIELDSAAGAGARFTLQLPTVAPQRAPAPTAIEAGQTALLAP
ncbi:ATP-binding protein [Massilia sp. DWR3-1-1]|uniref:ATP-binding protein n=1 Tax=Massilia sp. DWR3-1-1 TaxID=2804559 RepID=UPI003CF59A05